VNEREARQPEPRLDNQAPELFGQTPSQTLGPFFHYGLPWKGGADLVGASDMGARPDLFPDSHYALNRCPPSGVPQGEVIDLRGRVLDGNAGAVPDAMLEIWQADAAGRYAGRADGRANTSIDPHFIGFGRAATGADGAFHFRTIRPGRVPGPEGTLQAPHIALSVFGRGLLKRLTTRIYFADGIGNGGDSVLVSVPAIRRATLIAERRGADWWFDVVLQGYGETVFFAL
jgi:protocatechuate 3,4-dioxygenase alpha subunit